MSRTSWWTIALLGVSLASEVGAQPSPEPAQPSAPEAQPAPAEPPPAEPPPAAQPAPAEPEPSESVTAALPAEPPPPPPPSDAAPPELDEDAIQWPLLHFQARILAGYEVDRLHPEGGQARIDETQPEFFLDQAVIEVEAELSKRLHVELGFNLRNATVRDAYANYRVHDAFQLRLGRFKRQFSRLELRSRGKLPFRSRGIFNERVLLDREFAGRALGGMIWGKLNDQLRYYLGASNPGAIGSGIEGVDVAARITYEPVKGLSFGINAMHKWTERFADGPNLNLNAAGIDARAVIGDLEIFVEADMAQNPNPPPTADVSNTSRTPWSFGVIAYADYAFKVSKKWTIGPVVVLEWADTDTEYEKDERVRAVGGLSWNYKKNALRIMPQVEVARPLGGADVRGEVARETYYLLVSTEI